MKLIDLQEPKPDGYAVLVWPDGYDPLVFFVKDEHEQKELIERIETETYWYYDSPSHAAAAWVHTLADVDEIIEKYKLPDFPTDEDRGLV